MATIGVEHVAGVRIRSAAPRPRNKAGSAIDGRSDVTQRFAARRDELWKVLLAFRDKMRAISGKNQQPCSLWDACLPALPVPRFEKRLPISRQGLPGRKKR
jgi:hypothetical protein